MRETMEVLYRRKPCEVTNSRSTLRLHGRCSMTSFYLLALIALVRDASIIDI